METSNYSNYDYKDINSLEPRLKEYLELRKAYKKYNIDINILDNQFSITQNDKLVIKDYLRGNKNAYKQQNKDYVVPDLSFQSDNLRSDELMKNLIKKQQKTKDVIFQHSNFSLINNNQNMYNDPHDISSVFTEPVYDHKSLKHENCQFDDRYTVEQKNTDLNLQTRSYVPPPARESSYVSDSLPESHSVDDIMKQLDKYVVKSNNNWYCDDSAFTRNVGNTRAINDNQFRHQYDYIDGSIQNNSFLNMRGINSRSVNVEYFNKKNNTNPLNYF